ncbi:MAG: hypothetical protein U9M97_01100 [Candidatus Hadarchaeota archaeon]|nr:hypothetical protein [Candidatus Hadarchaeota archaeon]
MIGGQRSSVEILGIGEIRTVVEREQVRVEFLMSKSLTRVESEAIMRRVQQKFYSLKKFDYVRVGEIGFYIDGKRRGEKESAEELSQKIIKTVRGEIQKLVKEYDSIEERKRVNEELKRRGVIRMERCPSCGSTKLRPLGSAPGWPIYQLHAGQYLVCGVCGYHGSLAVTGDVGEEIWRKGFSKGKRNPKVSNPLFKRVALYFFVLFYLLLPAISLLFTFYS